MALDDGLRWLWYPGWLISIDHIRDSRIYQVNHRQANVSTSMNSTQWDPVHPGIYQICIPTLEASNPGSSPRRMVLQVATPCHQCHHPQLRNVAAAAGYLLRPEAGVSQMISLASRSCSLLQPGSQLCSWNRNQPTFVHRELYSICYIKLIDPRWMTWCCCSFWHHCNTYTTGKYQASQMNSQMILQPPANKRTIIGESEVKSTAVCASCDRFCITRAGRIIKIG